MPRLHVTIATLLMASLGFMSATASAAIEQSDSLFSSTVYFEKASSIIRFDYQQNASSLALMRQLFGRGGDIDVTSIEVFGSASPEGSRNYNLRLAERRAEALAKLIRREAEATGITPEVAKGIASASSPVSAYPYERYARLNVRYNHSPRTECAECAETEMPEAAATAVAEKDESSLQSAVEVAADENSPDISTIMEEDENEYPTTPVSPASLPATDSTDVKFPQIFLSTNLLYDAALVPNIGVGVNFGGRITLFADWMYARWNKREKRKYWRIYGGDIEVRYHIGKLMEHSPMGGHHIGAYASMACYDFQRGLSHRGVLSDKYNYAAGISYTYSLPVGTHINIDFNFGVGWLWGKYKKHTPIDDCDVWMSTHKLNWFGPTKAGVTLVLLVGKSLTNKRKGGAR